mmetsp:Transcript_9431/g.19299  ORF Transcript_9431/g.19299 Transcript_9431/m.19299 type:complete len:141 (-) Transcript_9431:360-782(-)
MALLSAALALLVTGCSSFLVALPPTTQVCPRYCPCAPQASRSMAPSMMWRGAKGIPKGKVPDNYNGKADDKSWGLYEFLSNAMGGSEDEPDTGPMFGKNQNQKGADKRGNFKGDRRVLSSRTKKTANEGAKFNLLDASTW